MRQQTERKLHSGLGTISQAGQETGVSLGARKQDCGSSVCLCRNTTRQSISVREGITEWAAWESEQPLAQQPPSLTGHHRAPQSLDVLSLWSTSDKTLVGCVETDSSVFKSELIERGSAHVLQQTWKKEACFLGQSLYAYIVFVTIQSFPPCDKRMIQFQK